MTTHRIVVVDKDGSYRNTILVDDAVLKDYWPGYGYALIDLGEEPAQNLPPPPIGKPADFQGVIDLKLSEASLAFGDVVDLKTGVVTKPQPAPVEIDPIIEIDPGPLPLVTPIT